MNSIINEIKGLDEYIKAMKKVYTTPQLSGDFENLLLHVNNLKSWAGINDEMSDKMGHKWISVDEKLPELREDNWSDNVLAWCNNRLHVMAYGYIDEGAEGIGYVWANCYNDIVGDPIWDDNFKPTHWMPLPSAPQP